MFNPEKAINKENPYEKLSAMMRQLADQVNKEFGEELLDEEGALQMRSFVKNKNGHLSKEDIKKDEQHINFKLEEWRGIYSKEDFLARRKKEKNSLLEMMITGILHKFLKDQFVVMRASTFDDYSNGIDNVIVDKQTGNVICAFDEVNDQTDHRYSIKKKDKILKKAKQGGTTVRYGITFQDGKLIKKAINNIPTFYLSMQNDELDKALNEVNADLNAHINQAEIDIFTKLVDLLTEEYDMLNNEKLPQEIMNNLTIFKSSLDKIKKIIN